jgi:hypothetical protein
MIFLIFMFLIQLLIIIIQTLALWCNGQKKPDMYQDMESKRAD